MRIQLNLDSFAWGIMIVKSGSDLIRGNFIAYVYLVLKD